MSDSIAKNFPVESLEKLWNSDKFWRSLVIGAIVAKVSTKALGAGFQYAMTKYFQVSPPHSMHEKDVVYLHIFPRNIVKEIPSASPFVIKMETWLQIHNIKHQVSPFMMLVRSICLKIKVWEHAPELERPTECNKCNIFEYCHVDCKQFIFFIQLIRKIKLI